FDDIHMAFGDLAHVRDAARRHMKNMAATDRAAIFTTSGQTELEFTDDRDKLEQTLLALRPRPIARTSMMNRPDVSYYMADLIFNKHDPNALRAATLDALDCAHLDPLTQMSQAQQMAQSEASRQVQLGGHESRVALIVLKDVVRRMSAMPGQRTIILASGGFI